MVVRYGKEIFEKILGLAVHLLVGLPTMTVLENGHTGPSKIEHLFAGLLERRTRKCGRSRIEVDYSFHGGRAYGELGRTASRGPAGSDAGLTARATTAPRLLPIPSRKKQWKRSRRRTRRL